MIAYTIFIVFYKLLQVGCKQIRYDNGLYINFSHLWRGVGSRVPGDAKRALPLSRGLIWHPGANKLFLLIAWLMAATLVTVSSVNAKSHFYAGNSLKE
jgi:hypothetical protein